MASVQPMEQLTLDNSGSDDFSRFLKSLSEKPKTLIRIFDRGDFFTVHDDDAAFAAKEFYKASSTLKHYGKTQRPYVCLSKINFEKFVRDLLLIRQYKVELFQQKNGKSGSWELIGKASPGNLVQFEDILFGNKDMSLSAIVMAIQIAAAQNGAKILGIAFADASLKEFGVCQVLDGDQLSNFEALLVQISPKECVISSQDNSSEMTNIKVLLERNHIAITERKKADFSTNDTSQDIDRLVTEKSKPIAKQVDADMPHSLSSLAALIKYLELLSDNESFKQYKLKLFDLTQSAKLDAAAVEALNLEPSATDGGNSSMNLTGLLNKCKTAQGSRLLAQWVKQPLKNKTKIEERLDLVEVFVKENELRQIIQEDHLRRIPDLGRLSKKFQRNKATLQDCVRVFQVIRRLPALTEAMNDYEGQHKTLINEEFIKPFQECVEDFTKFMDLIETTVDLAAVDQHEFIIKAEFDEGLQECKEKIDAITEQLPAELNKAARSLNLEANKTVKLDNTSQLGYFFRVTLKEEKILRNNKKFQTIETRKDGVRFINHSLKSLSDEYQTLKETYNSVQSQLVEEVLKIAGGYAEPMQTLNSITALLDVHVSLGHVAVHAPIPYVRPILTESGEGDTVLIQSRHPCLEAQDDVSFIPNDVKLVRGKSTFHIITGPNMGGKSTYIRQVGVIVLMAQIGSFVPCESATVSIVSSILARVGAGDCQARGVSTFMSEMLETAAILKNASSDSLIIIDELGRGTSTYDGFGLAWAISEHIAKEIGCFALFATHFHELTALADVVPRVKNLHVTALTDNDTLTLLYEVKDGVCDQSFGIHVAELAHFPKDVIEHAKRKANELEAFDGNFISNEEMSDNVDVATKKKRKDRKEGEEIITTFLNNVKGFCLKDLSSDELNSKLSSMIEDACSKDNEYISRLIKNESD